ncbi:MAG: hypothetical protein ACOH19_15410 [Rhodoglobus sp.]
MQNTSTHRLSRRTALIAGIPLVLLLAACGVPSNAKLGEGVRISEGTLAVTSIEERSAEDIADLELDELAGQTPYFVEYTVEFNDGEDSINENFWKGTTSEGEATPVNVLDFGGDFGCPGPSEVKDGKVDGCQLIMVPEGATLETVSFGGAGTWTTPAS